MKKVLTFFIFLTFLFLTTTVSSAQERKTFEYPADYEADRDLDGLTNDEEMNTYNTDPDKQDTDGDGYYDGVEVANGTDPLDANSFINPEEAIDIDTNPSWAWYVTRATALIAFLLLYIVIFLGLTVRLPFLNRIFSPLTSLKVHAWLSVQSLVFASAHGVALMFDKFFNFTWMEVFVPFAHPEDGNFVAMGVISFYIMILIILTSYFRHLMSHRLWRISHFLNIFLYVMVIIHALNSGTDLKNQGFGRDIFVWSNLVLAFLFVLNLGYRLSMAIKRKIAARKFDNTQIQ